MHKTLIEGKKYLTARRFSSYAVQIKEVFNFEPRNVLEIGSHRGIVTHALRDSGIDVTTMDIEKKWNPDIVGSVLNIPIENDSHDVVMCCEVLEHLPFESFRIAINEIRRVSTKGIIVSLPHFGRYYSITMKLPKIYRWHLKMEIPYFFNTNHQYDGDHYWEIGKKGYHVNRIRNIFKKEKINIIKEHRVEDNPYHHFFIGQKIL